jgi:hypothetical protein
VLHAVRCADRSEATGDRAAAFCGGAVTDPVAIPQSLRVTAHDAMKRDFSVVIPDLNRAGFSNYKLAYLIGDGIGESTVRRWASGESEPAYSKAIVLIALHDMYCVSQQEKT